jgi:3-dehydrosphinganine reductase
VFYYFGENFRPGINVMSRNNAVLGHDRIALVTGGSSGIGLAVARLLAQAGSRVWLLARRHTLLEAAQAEIQAVSGQRCGIISADVSDWKQVQAAVERVIRETGFPDLLINSAGVTHPGYVQGIPLEIFHEMMDINYFGTLHLVKALLPGMLERGSGHIVNISSAGGFVTGPGYGAYSPSKYAVRGFSDVLRAELKPHGLRVSLVFPPDTDTPQLAYEKSLKTPELQRVSDNARFGPFYFGLLSADEVARAILHGVQRGSYIILPGTGNKVLYHAVRLLGNLVYPVTDNQWAQARAQRQVTKNR